MKSLPFLFTNLAVLHPIPVVIIFRPLYSPFPVAFNRPSSSAVYYDPISSVIVVYRRAESVPFHLLAQLMHSKSFRISERIHRLRNRGDSSAKTSLNLYSLNGLYFENPDRLVYYNTLSRARLLGRTHKFPCVCYLAQEN